MGVSRMIAVVTGLMLVGAAAGAAGVGRDRSSEPYHVVNGWPVLPKDFAFGAVSGVSVDRQNRVCAFHRAENTYTMNGPLSTNPVEPIRSAGILCFDGKTGKLVAELGKGHFIQPHGLRSDPDGNLWTTDLRLQQVEKYSPDGRLLLTLGEERVAGEDERHFYAPTDIAFAPDGSVYVSDGYGNNRIVKFSAQGRFLATWGKKGSAPGEFDGPHSIVVDKSGQVYVADRGNRRIQIFDGDGRFIKQWDSASLKIARPWGLAISADNFLYLVDGGEVDITKEAGPEQMLKLDLSGHVVARWGSFGNYNGQIYWGHDIAVGPDGAVYVGDVWRSTRLQKFVPAGR